AAVVAAGRGHARSLGEGDGPVVRTGSARSEEERSATRSGHARAALQPPHAGRTPCDATDPAGGTRGVGLSRATRPRAGQEYFLAGSAREFAWRSATAVRCAAGGRRPRVRQNPRRARARRRPRRSDQRPVDTGRGALTRTA